MLISQADSAGTLYFLPDARGSTRALVDGTTGAPGQTFDYDAFGNLQDEYLNGLDTNYLYTGQQFDPISELYSLRARYYDPSLGRFLTRDTWPYDYSNPVELNRYVYTANNPVTYYDPSGHGIMGIARLYSAIGPYAAAFDAVASYLGNKFIHGFIAGAVGYLVGKWLAQYITLAFKYQCLTCVPISEVNAGVTIDWNVAIQGLIGVAIVYQVSNFSSDFDSLLGGLGAFNSVYAIISNLVNSASEFAGREARDKYAFADTVVSYLLETGGDIIIGIFSAALTSGITIITKTSSSPIGAFVNIVINTLLTSLANAALFIADDLLAPPGFPSLPNGNMPQVPSHGDSRNSTPDGGKGCLLCPNEDFSDLESYPYLR